MGNSGAGSAFWGAFLKQRSHIEELLLSDPVQAFLLLEEEIKKVDSRLQVEIGPGETAENLLVLSPAGNPDLLPLTTALVAAAPPVPGWQFLPAKPRKQFESIKFTMPDGSDEILLLRDFRFRCYEWEGATVELHLFHEYAKFEQGSGIGFTILDALLGEEAVIRYIARVELHSTDRQTFQKLRPLSKLPEFFGI